MVKHLKRIKNLQSVCGVDLRDKENYTLTKSDVTCKRCLKKMNLYRTKEWKENRDRIINDHSVCEWCSSKEKLAPHHFKGKIPNHSSFLFSKFLNSIYAKPYPKQTKLTVEEKRKFGKLNYQEFLKDEKLQEEIEKEYTEIANRYKSINPEDVIILCNRCHYATRCGRNLCPNCKKNYKKIEYETCFECKNKSEIEKGYPTFRRLSHMPQEIYEELERADNDAMNWLDEFMNASPERRKEMSDEQAWEQEKDYGIDIHNKCWIGYKFEQNCKKNGPGPIPGCNEYCMWIDYKFPKNVE